MHFIGRQKKERERHRVKEEKKDNDPLF